MTTFINGQLSSALVACSRRLSSSEAAPAGFWEVFCAKPRSRGRFQAQERRTPAVVPTLLLAVVVVVGGVQKTLLIVCGKEVLFVGFWEAEF